MGFVARASRTAGRRDRTRDPLRRPFFAVSPARPLPFRFPRTPSRRRRSPRSHARSATRDATRCVLSRPVRPRRSRVVPPRSRRGSHFVRTSHSLRDPLWQNMGENTVRATSDEPSFASLTRRAGRLAPSGRSRPANRSSLRSARMLSTEDRENTPGPGLSDMYQKCRVE